MMSLQRRLKRLEQLSPPPPRDDDRAGLERLLSRLPLDDVRAILDALRSHLERTGKAGTPAARDPIPLGEVLDLLPVEVRDRLAAALAGGEGGD